MVVTRSRDYELNPVPKSPQHPIPRENHIMFVNHHDMVVVALLSLSISIMVGVFITTLMV
tara:strand:- start:1206 stop:1385 length:180 start_codon:yes stop_codon:yes gene_type:complete